MFVEIVEVVDVVDIGNWSELKWVFGASNVVVEYKDTYAMSGNYVLVACVV